MNTVLLVDDQRLLLEIQQAMLSTTSCRVLTAGSGHAALTLMQRDPPDVVLIDLEMPILDGLQTFRRMREIPALAKVKTVLVAPEKAHLRCLAAGVDGVAAKPLTGPGLLSALQRFIALQKRTQLRINARFQADFAFGLVSAIGETRNLSLGGLFIRTELTPPLGTEGEVTLHGAEIDYSFRAQALRIVPGSGFAMNFMDPDPVLIDKLADELEARLAKMTKI